MVDADRKIERAKPSSSLRITRRRFLETVGLFVGSVIPAAAVVWTGNTMDLTGTSTQPDAPAQVPKPAEVPRPSEPQPNAPFKITGARVMFDNSVPFDSVSVRSTPLGSTETTDFQAADGSHSFTEVMGPRESTPEITTTPDGKFIVDFTKK